MSTNANNYAHEERDAAILRRKKKNKERSPAGDTPASPLTPGDVDFVGSGDDPINVERYLTVWWKIGVLSLILRFLSRISFKDHNVFPVALFVITEHSAISRDQVAQTAGVAESTISRWISGDRYPNVLTRKALLEELLDDLLHKFVETLDMFTKQPDEIIEPELAVKRSGDHREFSDLSSEIEALLDSLGSFTETDARIQKRISEASDLIRSKRDLMVHS